VLDEVQRRRSAGPGQRSRRAIISLWLIVLTCGLSLVASESAH
jgi:hypothetical protein